MNVMGKRKTLRRTGLRSLRSKKSKTEHAPKTQLKSKDHKKSGEEKENFLLLDLPLHRHTAVLPSMSKIFCDPVHGHILLHPACVAIIDTPEFQRLRDIKQTGLVEYVYPGATHNRFGHSLGVAYLAGLLVQQLRERQPELGITDVDVLCVEIAGLCHDLGHGPLSHTWEDFMQAANKQRGVKQRWKHEKVSQNLFEYLVTKNGLKHELKKFGIDSSEIQVIKDLIDGSEPKSGEKTFLYQIVNNEESGLDVDKWDYFLRDCHYLGLRCNFEYERLMQFAKVLVVSGKKQICFRDKVLEGVYNVFRTRSNLHRLAYQHRVVKVMETMFVDAVLKADGNVTGPSGEKLNFWEWSMSAAFSNGDCLYRALEKYCTLTESFVYTSLKHCSKPRLKSVSHLISAIEKRSCKCCGFYQQVALKISPFPLDRNTVLEVMAKLLPACNREMTERWSESSVTFYESVLPVSIEDISVTVTSVNWGKRDKNPVEFVHFYAKDSPFSVHVINHEESSVILPKAFEELQVLVVCRRSDDFALEVSKLCFDKCWQRIMNASHL